jgi:hypothetical protein
MAFKHFFTTKPVKTPKRFMDSGQTLYQMMDEILIVCPQCQSCAHISTRQPASRDWFAPRRLSCIQCGLNRDWAAKTISHSGHAPITDPFFGEPLWLQAKCSGGIVWAYNLAHLDLIERYIAADLREHRRRPDYGWQNSSLLNRLPRWMTASKNRDVVLKAIQKLKVKLGESA